MNSSSVHSLYCNFCGKSRKEVKVIFASNAAHMCNLCIIDTFAICFANGFDAADIRKGGVAERMLQRFDKMQFASLEELLREGGMRTSDEPFTGKQFFILAFTILMTRVQEQMEIEEKALSCSTP